MGDKLKNIPSPFYKLWTNFVQVTGPPIVFFTMGSLFCYLYSQIRPLPVYSHLESEQVTIRENALTNYHTSTSPACDLSSRLSKDEGKKNNR
ncbi:MAG: hypothetical protein Q8Q31_01505 [Nanoarchaeota archaeon]|nr:hypothetical protein [Nanoarchaeota archaeon]